MLRGPLLLSTFGLAINLILWSVPSIVGASALPHLIAPDVAPTLSQMLDAAELGGGQTPSLPDALLQLVSAEADALQVAAMGLQQPTPAELAPRANAAGGHVLEAVTTYARSAREALDRMPQ